MTPAIPLMTASRVSDCKLIAFFFAGALPTPDYFIATQRCESPRSRLLAEFFFTRSVREVRRLAAEPFGEILFLSQKKKYPKRSGSKRGGYPLALKTHSPAPVWKLGDCRSSVQRKTQNFSTLISKKLALQSASVLLQLKNFIKLENCVAENFVGNNLCVVTKNIPPFV